MKPQNPIIHPEARSLLDLLRRIEDALESSQDRLERPWDNRRPIRMENEETSSPEPKRRKPLSAYTASEQAIIRALERGKGRELTQQEVNLVLGQARHIGTLEEL
jgi:hypothetical protein